MDLNRLIEVFKAYYQNNGLERWLLDDQLLVRPLETVWNAMLERNPTVLAEMSKLNSSTSLAINYHEMFSVILDVEVQYEVAVAKPLLFPSNKGHSAMLDVKYYLSGTTYYVESKFLEPYYGNSLPISHSYFNTQYYENEEVGKKWVNIFIRINEMIQGGEFQYYDINQMLKHLLAIFRTKPAGRVVLRNLMWHPSEKFYGLLSKRSASFLRKREIILNKEILKSMDLFTDFIENVLHWTYCGVEIYSYSDVLLSVAQHDQLECFKRKYIIE